MIVRSLVIPLATAILLAGSAAPASAAIFSGDFIVQFKHRPPIDPSSLTPAQLTQLEDQCRERQIDSGNDYDEQDRYEWNALRATDAYCNSIGLP